MSLTKKVQMFQTRSNGNDTWYIWCFFPCTVKLRCIHMRALCKPGFINSTCYIKIPRPRESRILITIPTALYEHSWISNYSSLILTQSFSNKLIMFTFHPLGLRNLTGKKLKWRKSRGLVLKELKENLKFGKYEWALGN